MSIISMSTGHQQSINDFGQCILYDLRAVLVCLPILEVLVAIMGNMVSANVATPKNEHQQRVNRESTECKRFWVLHVI
jgi:hypothetical protein